MQATERAPRFRGWLSTDEEEVKRRWWRGRTDIVTVEPRGDGVFTDYDVTSSSGSTYRVELRSLSERINSCGCADFRTNRLGTCKHIEGVLHHLGQAQGHSPRIEVFVDERETRSLTCVVPGGVSTSLAEEVRRVRWSRARTLIEPAGRKLKAARLLAGEGLLDEARPSAVDSMMFATRALTVLDDAAEPDDADEAYAFLVLRQIEADALDPSRLAMEMLGGAELDDESLIAVGTFVDKVTGMVGDAP